MSKPLRIISALSEVKDDKHFDTPHPHIELKPLTVFCSKNADWYAVKVRKARFCFKFSEVFLHI